MRRAVRTALLLLLALPLAAAEVEETRRDAFKAYLEGEYLTAARDYEYLVTLGSLDPDPETNLALLHREMGRPDDAAAHWMKATLLAPEDPFLWDQRGWNYLALGRFPEARDSFREALKVSSSNFFAAEAQLGLGMTDSLDGNTKLAIGPLQKAAASDPYIKAAAEAELGRMAVRSRKLTESQPFLTLSLSDDRLQPDVAADIARVYEKTGQPRAAWQAYKLVLDLDPADEHAAKRKRKLERYIEGRPADSLPLLRLARPMLRDVDPLAARRDSMSPPLRVTLFTGTDGLPKHLTHFYVMGSTTTILWDLHLGEEMNRLEAFSQWEVRYRPDNRVIEIRDTTGNIIYATKQPFRLAPAAAGHSILIKNPDMTDIRGIDLSDREYRGTVEVLPTPLGFHLVNELPLEMYLFSITAAPVPPGSPMEAYKAVAVLLRTRMREVLKRPASPGEKANTCDSSYCIPYFGLSKERADEHVHVNEAVRSTKDIYLELPEGVEPEYHEDCGWATAGGIQDRDIPALTFTSAYDLEKLVHSYPDRAQYSEASALVPAAWTRWLRIFDAEFLRRNIERHRYAGPLVHVRVTERDKTGRVKALEVKGAKSTLVVSGEKAIEDFFSPGSLRSTLFTLQPVYKGRRLERLLVWGAGTGHGRGMSLAGAVGQAHLGRNFVQILSHYFPKARFMNLPPGLRPRARKPKPKARRKAPRKKRRTIRRPVKKAPQPVHRRRRRRRPSPK